MNELKSKGYISHKGWVYCELKCFTDNIEQEMFYAWLVFKNSIDLHDGEELLGAHTLADWVGFQEQMFHASDNLVCKELWIG